jgi:hypothetical protein
VRSPCTSGAFNALGNVSLPGNIPGDYTPHGSLVLYGNHAYMVNDTDINNNNLTVLDVTSPGSPSVVQQVSVTDPNTAAAYKFSSAVIMGTRMYAATDRGFAIFSLANPASPALVGAYTTGVTTSSFAVSGNYVYIGSAGIISVVDATSAANPQLLVKFSGSVNPLLLAPALNTLWVGNGSPLATLQAFQLK